jgi:hypothetical protein
MPPTFEAFRAPSSKNEQGRKIDNDMAIYLYAICMPEIGDDSVVPVCPIGTHGCHSVRDL